MQESTAFVHVNGKPHAELRLPFGKLKRVNIYPLEFVKFLNSFGDQRWEMIPDTGLGGGMAGVLFLFKRPKQE